MATGHEGRGSVGGGGMIVGSLRLAAGGLVQWLSWLLCLVFILPLSTVDSMDL